MSEGENPGFFFSLIDQLRGPLRPARLAQVRDIDWIPPDDLPAIKQQGYEE